MSDPFHNPYHFVPYANGLDSPHNASLVKKQGSVTLSHWPEHLTHDKFVSGTHSGRLVCRITVCELLAIGGKQTESNESKKTPRKVELFKLGNEFALPGSSLRGLLSSIAEAASNSALRVLGNEPLSISSGREGRTQLGLPYAYFPKDLLPLAINNERPYLSLAEQMFGVVEDVPEGVKKPDGWKAFTLASRLCFSNALAFGTPVQQTPVRMTQILSSPKSKSHNMYFELNSGAAYIQKGSLNPGKHKAKGRKFYLHQNKLQEQHWVTRNKNENANQKAEVAPLNQGQFWFHVDFDNLTDMELALLCYATRPAPDFRHKLGMGKPLGLGKIELDPMGLFLVDRQKRYSAPSTDRYHYVWRSEANDSWPDHYQREANARAEPTSPPAERAAFYKKSVPELKSVLEALELIGRDSPDVIPHPVHYPQVAQRNGQSLVRESAGFETDLYKWFVANDSSNSGKHHLRSLLNQRAIPMLGRDPKKPQPVATPKPSFFEWINGPKGKKGQIVSVKVKAIEPKMELVLAYDGTEYKANLTPQAREYVLSKNPPVDEMIEMRVKSYTPGNLQLDSPR